MAIDCNTGIKILIEKTDMLWKAGNLDYNKVIKFLFCGLEMQVALEAFYIQN